MERRLAGGETHGPPTVGVSQTPRGQIATRTGGESARLMHRYVGSCGDGIIFLFGGMRDTGVPQFNFNLRTVSRP